jgi:hypothetical protein
MIGVGASDLNRAKAFYGELFGCNSSILSSTGDDRDWDILLPRSAWTHADPAVGQPYDSQANSAKPLIVARFHGELIHGRAARPMGGPSQGHLGTLQ